MSLIYSNHQSQIYWFSLFQIIVIYCPITNGSSGINAIIANGHETTAGNATTKSDVAAANDEIATDGDATAAVDVIAVGDAAVGYATVGDDAVVANDAAIADVQIVIQILINKMDFKQLKLALKW